MQAQNHTHHIATLVRALVQAVVSGLGVWALFLLFSWMGLNSALSLGIAIVAVLAPGAYDYLDRDIFGNRLETQPVTPLGDSFIRFSEGKYSRHANESVNASDFVFVSRLLKDKYRGYAPSVAKLNLEQWQRLDKDHELVEPILESLCFEIDQTVEWAVNRELPLYPLFLMDILESLEDELGRFEPSNKLIGSQDEH